MLADLTDMEACCTDSQEPPSLFPRWVILLSLGVVLSTTAPLVFHALRPVPGQVFTGNFEAVYDQNTYLMWAEQVRQGHDLVYDLHTTEEHPPLFPGVPWLLVGLIARALGVPVIYPYHAFRLLFALAYLLLAWRLVCLALEAPRARVYAFVIIALGSGLGWLTSIINAIAGRTVIFSSDWMPEMWGYHSMLLLPHFTLSLLLIAALLVILLKSYRAPSWGLAVAAAAVTGLLALVHPFDIVLLGPLLVGHFVVMLILRPEDSRGVWTNLAAAAGVIPSAGFLFWQMKTNPIFAAWAGQNQLPSPTPLVYLIGLGVVLVLTSDGLSTLLRQPQRRAADWLWILWLPAAAIGAYSYPLIPFARRLVEGLHIPLALLAGIGVVHWWEPWLRRRWPALSEAWVRGLCLALLLACILPTNIKLLVDGALSESGSVPTGWMQAFEWLRATRRPTPA